MELQHNVIGVSGNSKAVQPNSHPDAQWFLKGGNLGLFIHYGISTVDGAIDLSWWMIPNKPWEKPMGVNRYIAHEKYWEHCHIWMIDGGWAHMDNDKGYKPAKWVVDQYKQCKEWKLFNRCGTYKRRYFTPYILSENGGNKKTAY